MISHRHRCIYIKVPRCASTSVLDWFTAHAGGRHSFRPYWYGGLLSERIQRVARAIELYPDYFTFTFVRNPWGRFVSIWRYVEGRARVWSARSPGHPSSFGSLREFAELCADVQGDFAGLWGREAREFFRANAEREYGPRRMKLRHLGLVTGHARRQVDFLPDCNRERLFGVERLDGGPLRFIGAVENMSRDFERLRVILDLPAAPLSERNRSGAENGPWAAHYDGATRRIVEELYAADLEFTGCAFGAGAPPGTPLRRPPGKRVERRTGPRALAARARFALVTAEVGTAAWVAQSAPARRILRLSLRLRQRRA